MRLERCFFSWGHLLLFSQGTEVQVPTPMSGSSQLPMTPAPGNMTASPGLCKHTAYTHLAYTHMHTCTFKNAEGRQWCIVKNRRKEVSRLRSGGWGRADGHQRPWLLLPCNQNSQMLGHWSPLTRWQGWSPPKFYLEGLLQPHKEPSPAR